jgi:uncharacterized protein YhbP (UPF0306 family)
MERVVEILASVSTLTLATANPDGDPHAAAVYFVHDDDLKLYFFSDSTSRHGLDVTQNPHAAAAIYPECEGWRDIRGLQLHGTVHLVESPEIWQSAWERYQAKFPFVRALKSVVSKNQLYVFIPTWIRLIDNAQGFGDKKEWNLT